MSLKEPDVWPPEGYMPVVTRTPEALEDERIAREQAEHEARIKATMTELGVSRKEALKIITGP